MKTNLLKTCGLLGIFIFSLNYASSPAHADDQPKHPRKHQVNGRLKNQQKRVDNGLANGSLKPGQAQKIQNQGARIKAQEQRDSAANGGHITQGEQRQLNREENGVSNEINRDEKRNTSQ